MTMDLAYYTLLTLEQQYLLTLEVGEIRVVGGRLPKLYETPILTWWITMA